MNNEDKCHYTNMLNRLKMLDEQICQMQTTLKSVKDIMRRNFEERNIDMSDGEKLVRAGGTKFKTITPKGSWQKFGGKNLLA